MIKLQIVSGEEIYINENFIESIEANSQADTNVRLHEGTTFVTKEKPEEIVDLIVAWNVRIAGR